MQRADVVVGCIYVWNSKGTCLALAFPVYCCFRVGGVPPVLCRVMRVVGVLLMCLGHCVVPRVHLRPLFLQVFWHRARVGFGTGRRRRLRTSVGKAGGD